jgi:hypothetical protein
MLISCITKRECNIINNEHWKNKTITSFYNWEFILGATKKEHNKDSRGMIEKPFAKEFIHSCLKLKKLRP